MNFLRLNTMLLLSAALFLQACAGGGNPDREAAQNIPTDQAIGGKPVFVQDGAGSLIFSNGTVGGTGSVMFSEELKETVTNHAFEITVALEPSGVAELVTFADRQLSNGFHLRFTRLGEGAGSLKVELLAQGRISDISDAQTEEDVRPAVVFADLDASQAHTFTVDIHNSERPSHVIIWRGSYDEAKAGKAPLLYNSAEEGEHEHEEHEEHETTSPGNGFGAKWGFHLLNAQVRGAAVYSSVHGD